MYFSVKLESKKLFGIKAKDQILALWLHTECLYSLTRRCKGVLQTFSGTETNKIWPHVEEFLRRKLSSLK